ncbi:MAG: hypothetical protein NWS46_03010 [Cyclobacteriaceae bacterium]|jgi:hypothetical protein|nr:hypothetical protein [Cyclobacteriaceae bacterium]
MKRRIVGSITMVLIMMTIVCCEDLFKNELGKNENISQFIDLDSILKRNIKNLQNRKLNKEVLLDGRKEEMNFISDTILLAGDFGLFEDINIGRPTFIGEYDIVEQDGVEIYNRKGKKGPQELILKKGKNNELIQIEAKQLESNMLYNSRLNYLLKFDSSTAEITEYKFFGYQKLIFKDTVFFSVFGKFESN